MFELTESSKYQSSDAMNNHSYTKVDDNHSDEAGTSTEGETVEQRSLVTSKIDVHTSNKNASHPKDTIGDFDINTLLNQNHDRVVVHNSRSENFLLPHSNRFGNSKEISSLELASSQSSFVKTSLTSQSMPSFSPTFEVKSHNSSCILEDPTNTNTCEKTINNHLVGTNSLQCISKKYQYPSLHSLDELNECLQEKDRLVHKLLEKTESFASVSDCQKDQAAVTDQLVYNREQRVQNVHVGRRNDEDDLHPPPPYSEYDRNSPTQQRRSAPTPVYYYQQPPPRNIERAPPYQVSDPEITMNLFDDRLIRKHFVAKVYTILSLQLLATFVCVIVCVNYKPAKLFFIRNYLPLYIVTSLIYVIVFLAFACFQSIRRIVPINFILLGVMTIAMSLLATTISSIYSSYTVMLSLAVTCAICFTITFIACLPCFDITGYTIYLIIFGVIVMIYGIIATIVLLLTNLKILYIIYAALATVLFSMYLLFDTQQLLAGKRIQLSPEEYIFGAMSLYVDILLIFLNVLTLCGNR